MRKLQGVLEKDHLTVSVLKCVISNHKQSSLNFCILRIVDQKIAGLDNELRKYKEQLKKATGATAASIKKRAMDVLKRKVCVVVPCTDLTMFIYSMSISA